MQTGDDRIGRPPVDLADTRRREAVAAVELWNVRLDLLRHVGDLRQLLSHIASPAELAGNNCECNNGCNVPCGSNCGMLGGLDRSLPLVNPASHIAG